MLWLGLLKKLRIISNERIHFFLKMLRIFIGTSYNSSTLHYSKDQLASGKNVTSNPKYLPSLRNVKSFLKLLCHIHKKSRTVMIVRFATRLNLNFFQIQLSFT